MKIDGIAFGFMLLSLVAFTKHYVLENNGVALIMLFAVLMNAYLAFRCD